MTTELGGADIQRADKIFKLVHFLNQNILNCSDQIIKNREFARLKISETLIEMILTKFDNESNFKKMCHFITQGLSKNDIKWIKKIEKYDSMVYDIDMLNNDPASASIFKQITLDAILG
jgi:hypothetical protein